MAQCITIDQDFQAAQPALCVICGCVQDLKKGLLAERFQLKNLASRNKRRVDIEKRVFDCRSNQGNDAFLYIRKQHVLLEFVEPVNFIEEEHGAHAVQSARLSRLYNLSEVLDTCNCRVEPFEMGLCHVCNYPGKSCFTGAGRAVKY